MVDKRAWLPGGRVLVSPLAIDHIDWNQGSVHLNMTRDEVNDSPEYRWGRL